VKCSFQTHNSRYREFLSDEGKLFEEDQELPQPPSVVIDWLAGFLRRPTTDFQSDQQIEVAEGVKVKKFAYPAGVYVYCDVLFLVCP
jgi:hypothetical protein